MPISKMHYAAKQQNSVEHFYYQIDSDLKKRCLICETNPIHWTNNNLNSLQRIFVRNTSGIDKIPPATPFSFPVISAQVEDSPGRAAIQGNEFMLYYSTYIARRAGAADSCHF
jgi:hypothetical protein